MNLESEENGTQRLLVVSEATSRDLLSYTVILVIICNAYQHLLEEISTLQVYLGHLTLHECHGMANLAIRPTDFGKPVARKCKR